MVVMVCVVMGGNSASTQAMHVKSPPTWKRAPTIRSGQEVGASGRAPGLGSCSSSLPSRAQGCKRSRVILMRTSISSTFIFCSDCHGRCGMISSAATSQFPRGSSRRVASDEKLGGPWTLTRIRSSTCCLQWVGPRWLCSKVVDELPTLVVMSSQPNATTIACPLVRLHVKVLYGEFKCHPCALDFSSCVRVHFFASAVSVGQRPRRLLSVLWFVLQ